MKKNQERNINALEVLNSIGMSEMLIRGLVNHLNLVTKNVESIKLGGKELREIIEFNKIKKLTLLFYNKNKLINMKRAYRKLTGLDELMNKFKEKPNVEDVLSFAIDKYRKRKDAPAIIEDTFLMNEKTLHVVSRATDLVHKVLEKTKLEPDEELIRFNLLYAYTILFEAQLVLLKSIYLKQTKVKNFRVEYLIEFFNKHAKYLVKNMDADLRNDAAHILFERRNEYNNKELEQKVTSLFYDVVAHLCVKIVVFKNIVRHSLTMTRKIRKGKK